MISCSRAAIEVWWTRISCSTGNLDLHRMRTLPCSSSVDCDTTDSSCDEGLMDNDFLFAKKPRSTKNVYMAVQQFTDCDSTVSGCNGGLMENDLLSSKNLDLHRIRRLWRIMQFANTTDSDFNGVSMDDAFLVQMKNSFLHRKQIIHTKLLVARSKNTAPTVCRTWKSTMPCIRVSLDPTARFGLNKRSPFVDWRFCGLGKRSPFVEWRI